jgi:hypothetical protein
MSNPQPQPSHPSRRGLIRGALDLFSSVRFGIVLLVVLFLYMSVGSAGLVYPIHPSIFQSEAWVHAQIRQWRPFEMTEFEWFHWWPFDVLMALLCITMANTTIRRIPFKAVNYGVWMIHTGIITLCIGSVIYFSTKVEGDAPVVRRAVTAALVQDGEQLDSTRFVAMPGMKTTLGIGEGEYTLEVTSIDPRWELLSGLDKGERAFSVNVMVNGPDGNFIRQLIAGHPEYTEDLVFTNDPQQPFQRSIKVNGTKIIDENLLLGLDYEAAEWFYLRNDLAKNWALYVRDANSTAAWVERPIDGPFLYNDYIADRAWVWNPGSGDTAIPIDPLDVHVGAVAANDPAPDITFDISGYLRYAVMRSQAIEGTPTTPLNPVVWIDVAAPSLGRSNEYQLVAFDPNQNTADAGLLALRWVSDEASFEAVAAPAELVLSIPELAISVRVPITDAAAQAEEFVSIGETKYGYRIVAVQNDLQMPEGTVSVAIVELQTPSGLHRRWVFDQAALTRDVIDGAPITGAGHTGELIADESIRATYSPGGGEALVTVVAGPTPDRLRVLSSIGTETVDVFEVTIGEPLSLAGGLEFTVSQYEPRAAIETKPFIVPPEQRTSGAKEFFSRVRVSTSSMVGDPTWLRFHMYPFESQEDVIRRHTLRPTRIALADGRQLDLLFSRRRLPLPSEIALDEFVLTTHVGGFTGETGTIRDYTSMLRFRDTPTDAWTSPVPVSMNKPVEHGGLWYFQAQWDPPEEARRQGDRASAGLNYTVLGVGNRRGVYIQLLGCIIAVLGMIYAFYLKPVLKQRARDRVYKEEGASS